jgi:uncharacterized protein (DUF2235 family)
MAILWNLIFSDGTGQRGVRDDTGNKNTNVFRLYLKAKDIADLDAFYDPGIGTPEDGEVAWATWGLNLAKKATGLGITDNIVQCYQAIFERDAHNRKLGLFGFSRGAYTVRCVGGVLSLLGVPTIIPSGEGNAAARQKMAKEAVEIYKLRRGHKKEGPERVKKTAAFRQRYACVDKVPDFIAVFDTVRSLGIPVLTDAFGFVRHVFQDNYLSPKVKCGLHALSIDENRKQFLPELWAEDKEDGSRHLEQVWFPGVHSDIGGGYADNRALADATMVWMAERLKAVVGLDLRLNESAKPEHMLGTVHNERTGLGVFWLEGIRDKILAKNAHDNSRLCQHVETRFDAHSTYRPKAAYGHPRLKKYYAGA